MNLSAVVSNYNYQPLMMKETKSSLFTLKSVVAMCPIVNADHCIADVPRAPRACYQHHCHPRAAGELQVRYSNVITVAITIVIHDASTIYSSVHTTVIRIKVVLY
jgi:hypothetical protein